MNRLTERVESTKKHIVYIETVQIKKVSEPHIRKDGKPFMRNGVYVNKIVTKERLLDCKVEEFLSKYNAQARIDNINFDAEEKMRNGILTRARLGE